MKIILTNDDGFDHPGIKALFKELHDKHEVFLIGPDQNRSGFSSAITFLTPLRHKKYADNIFSLNGTPVDCVKVATFTQSTGVPFRLNILSAYFLCLKGVKKVIALLNPLRF